MDGINAIYYIVMRMYIPPTGEYDLMGVDSFFSHYQYYIAKQIRVMQIFVLLNQQNNNII